MLKQSYRRIIYLFSIVFLITNYSFCKKIKQMPQNKAIPALVLFSKKIKKKKQLLIHNKNNHLKNSIPSPIQKKVFVGKKNEVSQQKEVEKQRLQNDTEVDEKPNNNIHYIRVLLTEHQADKEYKITLKAKDGFILESPAHSNITALFQENELSLLIKNGMYFLNCQDGKYRKIKHNDIEICSPSNKIILNGTVYQGCLHVCQSHNSSSTLIINKLDLEDYLYSVLRHEGIPSWPLEMHKVQAIASRTYALFHMKQSRLKISHPAYDIKNTSYFQIYNGLHEEKYLRKAVEETRNMVLTYNGDIALTMFDICCGGIIPAKLRLRDSSKPYLCRKKPCCYCKSSTDFTWKKTLSKKTMLDRLKSNAKCKDQMSKFGNTLVDMKVVDKDSAGIAHKIKCVGKKTTLLLPAHLVKSTLSGQLKSLAFSIKADNNRLVFSGYGNSHFMGLCQLGAKNLVARGWTVKEILQFYYPNTKLSYLK